MDGVTVKSIQDRVNVLGPYSLVILVISWIIVAGMYFSQATFGSALLALIAFTVLSPIGVFLGNKFRTIVKPDMMFTSGVGELVKTKIFWAIGPQVVGIIIAFLISCVFITTNDMKEANRLQDEINRSEEQSISASVKALNDVTSLPTISKKHVEILNSFKENTKAVFSLPRGEFEKIDDYNKRKKQQIAETINSLNLQGIKNNDIFIVKNNYVNPKFLYNCYFKYTIDKDLFEFGTSAYKPFINIPGKVDSGLMDVQFGDIVTPLRHDRRQAYNQFYVNLPVEEAKKLKKLFGSLDFNDAEEKLQVSFVARLNIFADVINWKIIRVVINTKISG